MTNIHLVLVTSIWGAFRCGTKYYY